ncbi:hypothetical protein CPC08DRAFT_712831 [Agrocybe pediades]|nr:hypothetical protein CPC08DRAFT_712831 [Agrocybe pediades]
MTTDGYFRFLLILSLPPFPLITMPCTFQFSSQSLIRQICSSIVVLVVLSSARVRFERVPILMQERSSVSILMLMVKQ